MARSNLDQTQIIREVFNPEDRALDVKIKDLAVKISLNHNEDSIQVVSSVLMAEIQLDTSLAVEGTKQITVYGPAGTVLKASPCDDKDIWYTVGTLPENGVLTLNICAIRLMANNIVNVVAI
jgi:hypothetical protein